MKKRFAVERRRLASLAEARSMLWTLQQLTAKTATCERAERSYLFELHQIAARGRDAIERVIDDMEFDSMRLRKLT